MRGQSLPNFVFKCLFSRLWQITARKFTWLNILLLATSGVAAYNSLHMYAKTLKPAFIEIVRNKESLAYIC